MNKYVETEVMSDLNQWVDGLPVSRFPSPAGHRRLDEKPKFDFKSEIVLDLAYGFFLTADPRCNPSGKVPQ